MGVGAGITAGKDVRWPSGGVAGGALLFVLAQPPAPKATVPVAMNHISAQRFGFPGTLCQKDTKRGLPHPPLALVHQL